MIASAGSTTSWRILLDYSLNPGRYVGVVIEDDGMSEEEFKTEMRGFNAELTKAERRGARTGKDDCG